MNLAPSDRDLLIIGSVIVALVVRTVHASLIYAKMKAQLDEVTKNCITLADFIHWQAQLNVKNKDLIVPDLTRIIIERKQATAGQQA